jgi:feruloyl esterase
VFGVDFNYRKFDFDRDQDTVDAALAPILNANNPDVSGMRKQGGKILMFTGTADPLVPFQDTLNYYERVVRTEQSRVGKEPSSRALARTQEFFRYFLVPGMGHCTDGPGLTDFGQLPTSVSARDSDHDILSALVKWVEQGVAPGKIIATAFVDGIPTKGIHFQRPICPYPKFPNYIGGDWKSPSSYRCTDHPRGEVLVPAEKYLN